MNKQIRNLADALKGMHVKSWEQRIHDGKTRVVYVRYHENITTTNH